MPFIAMSCCKLSLSFRGIATIALNLTQCLAGAHGKRATRARPLCMRRDRDRRRRNPFFWRAQKDLVIC